VTAWDDLVAEVQDEVNEPSRLIMAAYENADRHRIRQVLLTEYRCRGGCLLWHAWQSPRGVYWYAPGYQLSPAMNEQTTNPKARAKRTTDGAGSWRPRAGQLDLFRSGSGGFLLCCDHFRDRVSVAQIVADADQATPGKPTRRLLS
jgi:hypothetical protein